jgi:hypothetical protein
MYHTRFVFPIPLKRAHEIAGYVAKVIEACGTPPINVQVSAPDNIEQDASVTVTYSTNTATESDTVIKIWRQMQPNIQVERMHKLDPHQFEAVAMSDARGGSLKRHIATEVRRMCNRGVGSAGILNYLEECECVVAELREFVESQRASV